MEEIKKSYRALAHVYHPDKNQGNDIVSSYFTEVQEAYSVLSNPISKRVYDRERSRLRQSSGPNSVIEVTTESILKELDQLSYIIHSSNSGSINKELVLAYLKFLFTKQNIAILIAENKEEAIVPLVTQALIICNILDFFYFDQLQSYLVLLANHNEQLVEKIQNISVKKKNQALWIKLFPVFISVITLIICLMMYFYAQN